ncbi:MAG: HNH endonuclease [Pyrinomonadaceae bacterium]|nr:HNH endonuclease [Pyrinomonadaceae bacterium]
MSEYISIKLRNLVRKRANKICEYCHIPEDFTPQPFCFEHILPKVSGGKTSAGNLALACQGCNAFKASRTEFEDEITGESVKLFNPRKSVWNEHFIWSEDFTEIVGITSYGRATVEALKMNRLGLINLRRVLYGVGVHPPIEQIEL